MSVNRRVLNLYPPHILGAVRLTTGTLGLFAPEVLAKRFGDRAKDNAAVNYAFRLFGVRTIILGAELFLLKGEGLDRAVRLAPIIHGSDTIAALIASRQGQVSKASGLSLVAISATNTVLALLSQGARTKPPAE